jgi:hypothetical protein
LKQIYDKVPYSVTYSMPRIRLLQYSVTQFVTGLRQDSVHTARLLQPISAVVLCAWTTLGHYSNSRKRN